MSIGVDTVLIDLSANSQKHYEELGYDISRRLDKKGRMRVAKGTKIEIKVTDLPKGSDTMLPKYCDICGSYCGMQTYYSINKQREKGDGKDYCRKCSGLKISKSLLENVPYDKTIEYVAFNLTEEWSSRNNRLPSEVNVGSDIKYWWICPDCGSEYDASPYGRVYKNQNCGYCSGHKVNETNCLATLRPELIEDWHPTLNKEITPYNITLGSSKEIWWICKKCRSEYDATIQRKMSYTTPCPYCAGTRVNHTNCLATKHPEITKEWHPTKNGKLTPNDVTSGSHKKIWWKCSIEKCGHVWETQVKTRLRSGCPSCNESKGERKVKEFLLKNNIVYKREFEFNNLIGLGGGKLRFDFAVFNNGNKLILLIEYDGQFHFKDFYKDGTYEIITTHDNLKNTYCVKNNIPLLRIPYWKFNKIEKILCKELSKYEIKTTEGVEI